MNTHWLPAAVAKMYYDVFTAYVALRKSGERVSSELRAQMLTKTIRSMEGYAFNAPGVRVSQRVIDLHPDIVMAIRGKEHWPSVQKAVAKLLGTSTASAGANALPIYIEHPRSITAMIDDIVERLMNDALSVEEFTEIVESARPVLIHREEVKISL